VGLTEGEGSFIISIYKQLQTKLGFVFTTIFCLSLKSTKLNIEALKKIKNYIGEGYLLNQTATWKFLPRIKQSFKTTKIKSFQVTSLKGCLKIIEIFDRCKMYSQKKKDYELWKEAVLLRKKIYYHPSKFKEDLLRLLKLKQLNDKKTHKGRKVPFNYKQLEQIIKVRL